MSSSEMPPESKRITRSMNSSKMPHESRKTTRSMSEKPTTDKGESSAPPMRASLRSSTPVKRASLCHGFPPRDKMPEPLPKRMTGKELYLPYLYELIEVEDKNNFFLTIESHLRTPVLDQGNVGCEKCFVK
ncbi:hypothetical protein LIER_40713 [Lithospermum erythrorhizon]|uniref:Uncharacterized protein n=1 Tax=Lithospermum erythrorhizon TaxID=34254 RepID=A0AAV3QYR6_LITER